jgi:arginase
MIEKQEVLYLHFPQWQGSGTHYELKNSSYLLLPEINQNESFVTIAVGENEESKSEHVMHNADMIRQLEDVKTKLQEYEPDKIYTLGGDCGVEVGPIHFLNEKYKENLLVIWMDAHADFNRVEHSPSHHFHGMVLRALIGEGPQPWKDNITSPLKENQILLFGTRDTDPEERRAIAHKQVKLIFVEQATQSFRNLLEMAFESGYENVYIHLDLDVLEPNEFENSLFHVSNGLSVAAVTEAVDLLKEQFNVVGGSVVEYVERNEIQRSVAAALVNRLFF